MWAISSVSPSILLSRMKRKVIEFLAKEDIVPFVLVPGGGVNFGF